MGKMYLSIEEAGKLLPEVSKRLKKLKHIKAEMTMLSNVDVQYSEQNIENDLMVIEVNKNYHKLSYDFFKELQELTKMGCIVKDIEAGIIDFYSKFGEQDIFLCWKKGEPNIGYWHYLDSGFNSRTSISLIKNRYAAEIEKMR